MSEVHQPNLTCEFKVFSNPLNQTRQILISNKDGHVFGTHQMIDLLYKWSNVALSQLDVVGEEKEYPDCQVSLSTTKDESAYIFSLYSTDFETRIDNEALAFLAKIFCEGFYKECGKEPPKEGE